MAHAVRGLVFADLARGRFRDGFFPALLFRRGYELDLDGFTVEVTYRVDAPRNVEFDRDAQEAGDEQALPTADDIGYTEGGHEEGRVQPVLQFDEQM